MDYKGYYVSDVQSEILIDILQTQKEILAELKKLNEPVTNVQIDPEYQDEECIGLTEEVQEAVTQATEQIEALSVTPVKKPAPGETKLAIKQVSKSPVKKKSAKKKSANRTKTATK